MHAQYRKHSKLWKQVLQQSSSANFAPCCVILAMHLTLPVNVISVNTSSVRLCIAAAQQTVLACLLKLQHNSWTVVALDAQQELNGNFDHQTLNEDMCIAAAQ